MHSPARPCIEFVEQIQKCFCEDLCRRTRYKDDPCPAMRLVELMNWLKAEMDDLSGSQEMQIRTVGE